jgi:hypothetical protein
VALNDYQLQADVTRLEARLAAVEEQLKRVSEAAGVPFDDPASGVPDEVVELARSGDRVNAVRRYRELTNVDGNEARAVVDRL